MLSSQQSYNYYVRNGGPWHRAGDWTGLILIPGGCSLGHRHYRLEHKVLVTHGLLAGHSTITAMVAEKLCLTKVSTKT